ncbi:Protein TOS1 [Tolypocladium ophioglossoides CBS 100239]|uniref:glucan endo-1,3-beta-D-glucosidase n=1 Tax=Tolypocladium ophioglossoides (strain CBS 100239) TaxID=1163406 RepID=A0A0L0NBN5_TOLOC|nr:Protein TOS1 [Tolypocladium ophioglossoides CBS 100239]
MKYSTSLLLASAGWASAIIQQCSGNAVNEGGNWFCGKINHILYEGFVGKGSFKAVTDMGSNGECKMEDKSYNGPLAPLDADLSIHVRGPIQLKEAAVYNLAPKKKHSTEAPVQGRSLGHPQGHEHQKKADMVTATIDGKVVSWQNNWFGPPTTTPAPVKADMITATIDGKVVSWEKNTMVTATIDGKVVSWENNWFGPSTKAPAPTVTPPPAPPHPTPPAAGGPQARSKLPPTSTSPSDWNRVAYYSSEKQVVENMVFMGNYGGQGSGVFDYTWGNSLAYLNADGNGGASSPQILKDINIPSNQEFSIFSAEKCDASCGFSRAKDIAYKGFGGATKVFLFHFKMPLDGDRGNNGDMPALWALNARIPRTGQYNACSCWTTGCGEIDIYEVLAKGDTKCKSAFHLASGACSSDFFERPVDKFIKVAVVFNEATASVSIQRLRDNTDFSKGLNNTTVQDWIKGPKDGKLSSLFQLT